MPTSASVAVALVGTGPVGNFRSILLNISGIRINKTSGAATNAPGWFTLAVPQQAGSGNGQNPGDLQIDLLHTQTAATVYNVSGAPVGTYNTVQVLVDQTDPGSIVPACQSGLSNTEGCINYGMLFNGNNLGPVIVDLATPLTVAANATAPLVIALDVSIITAPATTGDPYIVDITPNEANVGSFLAQVSGNITVKGNVQPHIIPLTVSAELSGTSNVIETVPVGKKGFYSFELPAATNGTSYDIFTNGGGATYGAVQGINVVPGQFVGGTDLTVTAVTPGGLSGTLADNCTSLGIPGAQLELLAPAIKLPTPRPTPAGSVSFCFDHPEQCVVVANANADQGGNYPLPGTKKNPAGFAEIPTGQNDLALRISASGYTSLLSSAFVKTTKVEICSAATSTTACNFSLTTGYINGLVNLVSDPPPGNSVMVQVFAENAGTNELVSALPQPLVFLNHQNSLPFQLNVPINPPNPMNGVSPPFDLFAVAIDPFEGGPNPFPGHDIPVLANQPAPNLPKPGTTCLQSNAVPFLAMDCVGHGSISGTVQNPDAGTSVEVEKADPSHSLVQLLGTSPALFSSTAPSNNAYTLCVPPDNYVLQRFESAPFTPGGPTPSPTPVGAAQSIMVPAPAATSSPCPSTCSNSNSGPGPCPGPCNATLASPL